MKKILLTAFLLAFAPSVFAHTTLLSCFDEGDGTVTCEGGFSDGSSASGVNFYVEKDGEKVVTTTFDALNTVNFEKPEGDYKAVIDAGEGHQVIIESSNIN